MPKGSMIPLSYVYFLMSLWLSTLFNYDIQTLMQNNMCDLRKFTRPLYYKLRNTDLIVETFYIEMGESPNKKPEGGEKAWFKRRKIRSIRGIPKFSPFIFNDIVLKIILIYNYELRWYVDLSGGFTNSLILFINWT